MARVYDKTYFQILATDTELDLLFRFSEVLNCKPEQVGIAFVRFMLDREGDHLLAFEKAIAEGKNVSLARLRYGRMMGIQT